MFKDVYQKNRKTKVLYTCENCKFVTSDKAGFNRHLLTLKHQKTVNVYQKTEKTGKIIECECGKIYSHKQTLYVHKKKCNYKIENSNIKEVQNEYKTIICNMFDQLKDKNNQLQGQLNQNSLLQNALIEMIPKMGTTNINNGTINKLNVQLYLNENCKDAMSISDFVSGMSVEVSDLLVTKEKGAIEGISAILINHLNKLPMCQRPLWCSDKKRKRLFVKEAVWEEDTNNEKTKEAIYNISKVQTRNLTKYIADKPDWIKNDNHKDEYMLIIRSATETMQDRTEKVIDKILNEISFTDNKKYI